MNHCLAHTEASSTTTLQLSPWSFSFLFYALQKVKIRLATVQQNTFVTPKRSQTLEERHTKAKIRGQIIVDSHNV
jgi:hypothetical protein